MLLGAKVLGRLLLRIGCLCTTIGMFVAINAINAETDSIESKQSLRLRNITAPYVPAKFDEPRVKIPGRDRPILEGKEKDRCIWKSVAPGFMNVVLHAIVRGETISMLIDIGGIIQSTNGGQSWRYLTFCNEGGMTAATEYEDFDIHPRNEAVIMLVGRQVLRTENGGRSWVQIHDGLPSTEFMTRSATYAKVKFTSDGSRIFIGTKAEKNANGKAIFVSDDNSKSFRRIAVDSPYAAIKEIYPHPYEPDCLFLSFADGELFITKNAKEPVPVFRKVPLRENYWVRDMCIDPENPATMLLVVNPIKKDAATRARILRCSDIHAEKIEMTDVPINDDQGSPAADGTLFTCARYNPGKPGQIVVGGKVVAGSNGNESQLLISEDNLKSFRAFSFPQEFYCDDNLSDFYAGIYLVFFGISRHAVVVSRVGTWESDDNFRSLKNLTMTYSNGYYGNRGVGMPANINRISAARENVFFSAQDHGAWMSGGVECSNWQHLTGRLNWHKFPTQTAEWGGQYTWTSYLENIFASEDEKYIYVTCNARVKKTFKHGFYAEKKLLLTEDTGASWQDVTSRLGKGDVYPEGSRIVKLIYDPTVSYRQWLLFSDALFFTGDGGKSFIQLSSPHFVPVQGTNKIYFSDMAYDHARNVLYLSCVPDRLNQKTILGRNKSPAAFFRSADMGKTWEIYDIGQNAVRSVGVTTDGALIVGTMRSGEQPGRLIRIPYRKNYDHSMIKLTVGDTPEEVSANQISVWPIVCDGNDVLAYSSMEWLVSDRFYPQGPLLSRDGGETFQWILHDLPQNFIWSADMKNGRIYLGTTAGLMYWKYK
ncbi:MAG: hypothetical protein AABZ39_14420 [Spirochaetota bacterium]